MVRSALCCVFVAVGLLCCVNAWPSRLAKKQNNNPKLCAYQQIEGCAFPVMLAYYGMSEQQIRKNLTDTPLSQTCRPVLSAVSCTRTAVKQACNLDINDIPIDPDELPPVTYLNVINYVCTEEVAAFDRNKQCLINKDWQSLVLGSCMSEIQSMNPSDRCPPKSAVTCVLGVVRSECNNEIADRINTLSNRVLASMGCSTGNVRRNIDWEFIKRAVVDSLQ